jgi:hypothetical protein
VLDDDGCNIVDEGGAVGLSVDGPATASLFMATTKGYTSRKPVASAYST